MVVNKPNIYYYVLMDGPQCVVRACAFPTRDTRASERTMCARGLCLYVRPIVRATRFGLVCAHARTRDERRARTWCVRACVLREVDSGVFQCCAREPNFVETVAAESVVNAFSNAVCARHARSCNGFARNPKAPACRQNPRNNETNAFIDQTNSRI